MRDSLFRRVIPALFAIYLTFPCQAGLRDYQDFLPVSLHEQAKLQAKANALAKLVEEENLMIHLSDPAIPLSLPRGISKTVAGRRNVIVLDAMRFTANGGYLEAYMTSTIPRSGDTIGFAGLDIPFGPGGMGEGSRLQLISECPIPLGGNNQLVILPGNGDTHVEWDCNGFVAMGVMGRLEFDPEKIAPAEDEQEPAQHTGNNPVIATFTTVISGWNDLLVNLSIPDFQLKFLPGYTFSVRNAVFDFSDTRNGQGVNFPVGYNQFNPFAGDARWQGVYIREASITLPGSFQSEGVNRTSLVARDLLIDGSGFTGVVGGRDLIPIEKGNLGGWAFSLEQIDIGIMANELKSFSFGGQIQVPLLDNSLLTYAGSVDQGGNYHVTAGFAEGKKYELPGLGGSITVSAGSRVTIARENGQFYPKAVMNGQLTIGGSGSIPAKIANIEFEELVVQTKVPYLDVKAFSLTGGGQNQLSGFPITLKNIVVYKQDQVFGLGFEATLNLVGEGDGGFSAGATFRVNGKWVNHSGRNRFEHDGVEVSGISVDIDGGAFRLKGGLVLYRDDPVYGDGFKGDVDAWFLPGIQVAASAQFGSTPTVGRYWYADAKALFNTGIPVFPGFGIYGFGGGASYKMRKEGQAALTAGGSSLPPGVGQSRSGFKYVPDAGMGLGIRAMATLGTHPSPNAFNADAGLEVMFFASGGVKSVGFTGNAYFMTDLKNRGNNPPLYANLTIDYDFSNKTLYGNLSAYVNIVSVLRGANPGNHAGSAVLYFGPDDWYIHVGTPDQRIGLEFVGLLKSTSYFMVGTHIPAMPPPPAKVSEILNADFDFMRDENSLGSGSGFAFGSSIEMSTGRMKFTVFYASFDAGMGFDVMLKNYGMNTRCEGRSSALGINGWYASGQVYAYLQGEIGIQVNLPFKKGDFKILDIGAAAILQAKLPNPTWISGTVGGYYNILGGIVKGSCKFSFTLGEECTIVHGTPLQDIGLIASISPPADEKEVNVFNTPQVAFDIPVGTQFDIEGMEGKTHKYRATLDHFVVKKNNIPIAGSFEWNHEKTVIAFKSTDVLPELSQIELDVQISFEEFINGKWTLVKDQGKEVKERKTWSFETGPEPNAIYPGNVKYSYPASRQLNFYPGESNQGYIRLKQGQNRPFNPGEGWTPRMRFRNQNGTYKDVQFSYDTASRQVNFPIPAGLQTGSIHHLELVHIPTVATQGAIDSNIEKVTSHVDVGESQVIEISSSQAQGTRNETKETLAYSQPFRVSQFTTLSGKLSQMYFYAGVANEITNGAYSLSSTTRKTEGFDEMETGANGQPGWIRMRAVMTNPWFSLVMPAIYNVHPIDGRLHITRRDTTILGLAPFRANYITRFNPGREPEDLKLEDIHLTGTPVNNQQHITFVSEFGYHAYHDYIDLRTKCAAEYYQTPREATGKLLYFYFPDFRRGNYQFFLDYYLPGASQPATSTPMSFTY